MLSYGKLLNIGMKIVKHFQVSSNQAFVYLTFALIVDFWHDQVQLYCQTETKRLFFNFKRKFN